MESNHGNDDVAGEEDEEGEVKLSLADEELLADLTYDELKQAFRFVIIHIRQCLQLLVTFIAIFIITSCYHVLSFIHLDEHEIS